ncbi:hypothetical protein D931_00452 [Enterococcus faecium 13.SD.W.09]|nr:hypothetical protein D931_00452 [Enterococcus faecium 13.SD.W.09]
MCCCVLPFFYPLGERKASGNFQSNPAQFLLKFSMIEVVDPLVKA